MGTREKIIVGILAGLLLVGVVLRFSGVFSSMEGVALEEQGISGNIEEVEAEEQEEVQEETIKIHVVGEVANPGVYDLSEGAIVQDVLEKAGGATAEADDENINLARPLIDGEQVVVPEKLSEEEIMEGSEPSASSDGLVNINQASASELESLSGIGEKRASSIVDYREENGPFRDVDELMDVPNIGSGILEGIEDEITIY